MSVSSVMTTVGAAVAVVSPITALSWPSGETLPALSVRVAFTSMLPPSAGRGYSKVRNLPSIWAWVRVIGAWPLTVSTSPATAPAGSVTCTPTVPLISVRLMVPSLSVSSVMTTVGAAVAVVSPITALSWPSGETLPALSVRVAFTSMLPPSAGRGYSKVRNLPSIWAWVRVIGAWPLTVSTSPATAPAGSVTCTPTVPLISVRLMVPSLSVSSVMTTVGAAVAVVSPITALSWPSGETLPALSVRVAFTSMLPPSAGRGYSKVRNLPSICAWVRVIGAWPLTVSTSPATAPAGSVTCTPTVPLISVRLMVPSLSVSSVMTTVGAAVAVVSPITALSWPSGETLPALSVRVAFTSMLPPSAGRGYSKVRNLPSICAWVRVIGAWPLTVSTSPATAPAGSVTCTPTVPLISVRLMVPSLSVSSVMTTVGAAVAVVSPITALSWPSGETLPALSVRVAFTSMLPPSAGRGYSKVRNLPSIWAWVRVIGAWPLTVSTSPTTAPAGSVTCTPTVPLISVRLMVPSLSVSSVMTTVGAAVAVVSPITALSWPSGETLPALSVRVAFTSMLPPSAGRGYSKVRNLPSICAWVRVIGAWPLTVSTSPATAPAGSVTCTPTVPLISVRLMVPSLSVSSVMTTVGAAVAVVSPITALSWPSGETLPALSVRVAFTSMLPPSAGRGYSKVRNLPSIWAWVRVIGAWPLTVSTSPATAPAGSVTCTPTVPLISVRLMVPSLSVSSVMTTVGAAVAVVSPITALSWPSGETLPALSVRVAFTSMLPPSAGRGYSKVRNLPSICAWVRVIGAWPLTVSTSPATAPAGSVTCTPTVPLISVRLMVPSLSVSSVMTTVGAAVAVVSPITALSWPSGETLPALSVRVAFTSMLPPSAGRGYSKVRNLPSIWAWVRVIGAWPLTVSTSPATAPAGSVTCTPTVPLISVRLMVPSLSVSSVMTTVGAAVAVVSPITALSWPSGETLPALSVRVAFTSMLPPSAGRGYSKVRNLPSIWAWVRVIGAWPLTVSTSPATAPAGSVTCTPTVPLISVRLMVPSLSVSSVMTTVGAAVAVVSPITALSWPSGETLPALSVRVAFTSMLPPSAGRGYSKVRNLPSIWAWVRVIGAWPLTVSTSPATAPAGSVTCTPTVPLISVRLMVPSLSVSSVMTTVGAAVAVVSPITALSWPSGETLPALSVRVAFTSMLPPSAGRGYSKVRNLPSIWAWVRVIGAWPLTVSTSPATAPAGSVTCTPTVPLISVRLMVPSLSVSSVMTTVGAAVAVVSPITALSWPSGETLPALSVRVAFTSMLPPSAGRGYSKVRNLPSICAWVRVIGAWPLTVSTSPATAPAGSVTCTPTVPLISVRLMVPSLSVSSVMTTVGAAVAVVSPITALSWPSGETLPALSVRVAFTSMLPPSAGRGYSKVRNLPSIWAWVRVIGAWPLTVSTSPTTAPAGSVTCTPTVPLISVRLMVPSLSVSSVMTTVGAAVAVVSPITALSWPSGETLPALSVRVAFTSMLPPSAGRGYSKVRNLPSICAWVRVIGAWPLTVSTSPATAPAGSVTCTPTVPLISVRLMVPSLSVSSVMTTVGAAVAVVSPITALSWPSGETLPALSVRVAFTSMLPPSAGRGYSKVRNLPSICAWVRVIGAWPLTVSTSPATAPAGSVTCTPTVPLISVRLMVPSLSVSSVMTTVGAAVAVVSPITALSWPSGETLPALSVRVAFTSMLPPSAGRGYSKVRNLPSICAWVRVIGAWPLTVSTSPATAPAGSVTCTPTVPLISVRLMVPSLSVSSVMTTVGAAVAVVSPITALSWPSGETLPALSVRVAFTSMLPPSAGRGYSKVRNLPSIWAWVRVIGAWPLTVSTSPATAPAGSVTCTPTVPLISVRLMVPSLSVSSVMTTVGAAVAVVSPITALSWPSGETLPALSVRVAFTSMLPPSAGRGYSKVRNLPSICAWVRVIGAWPLTVSTSPATAPAGSVTCTPTVPLISVRLMVPSLSVSSVMTTVGAAVAVVSPITALSWPSGETLPALSVRVAFTSMLPPSAGRGYSKVRNLPSIWAWVRVIGAWPLTVSTSPTTAPAGSVTCTPTVPLISVRLMVPSLFTSSVMTTVGAPVASVSVAALSLPPVPLLPARSV
ncbi:hypothetical protein KAM339_034830 [Aeromonas caviae]|nr:hypothetical protein KAM339_034830 [Aeromonas caviae]